MKAILLTAAALLLVLGEGTADRIDPVEKDEEGVGEPSAFGRHQGPVWLLLPEERRLLSRQRRHMHRALSGHHLLL